MSYLIKRTLDPLNMETGEVACYPWGGSYRPRTTFRAGHDGRILRVLMRCEERDPLARVRQHNGMVWHDSCMEFFLAPGPRAGYFNFEMNAQGVLLLHYGRSGADFTEVDFVIPGDLALTPLVEIDAWTLDLRVPFDFLRRYAPAFQCAPGLAMRGNFYKCGDETASPHFGCHFPIDPAIVPEPNFHRPEFFGALILE